MTEKIAVLCLREAVSLSLPAIVSAGGDGPREERPAMPEDAVEEIVVCLAAIEAAWAAGEFRRLSSTLASVAGLARATGLPDVARVADSALELVQGHDDVALAAVVARLVRLGEASLATLLEISYRQL